MPVEAIGALRAELSASTAAWQKSFDDAAATVSRTTKRIERLGRSFGRIGGQMERAGRSLSTTISAPLLGLGFAAAKVSIDFESAFAGVRKTVEASEEDFKGLEQGFRNLTKEVPKSAAALARIGEAGGQLGIAKENLLEFTRVVAGMAEATDLTADQAATAFARIANLTGLPQTEFSKLGSAIVDLGNNGASTESEITEMSLRLAAAGKGAGLSTPEILGFAAALANVGIEAQAGGSALSRIIKRMQRAVAEGGVELERFAATAGQSVGDFKTLFERDAAGAIQAFLKGLSGLGGTGALQALDALGITEIRTSDAASRLALSHEQVARSLEIARTGFEENTALNKETAQRYATTQSQLIFLKEAIRDVGIELGVALLPAIRASAEVLRGLAERLKEAVQAFQRLPDWVQVAAGVTVLAAALAGPLLFALGNVATGLSSVIRLTATLAKTQAVSGVLAWGVQLAGVNGVIGALSNSIPVLTARLALMQATSVVTASSWGALSSVLSTAGVAVGGAAAAGLVLGSAMERAGAQHSIFSKHVVEGVEKVSLLRGAISLLPDLLRGLWGLLKNVGGAIADVVRFAVEWIAESRAAQVVMEGLRIVLAPLSQAWDLVSAAVEKAWGWLAKVGSYVSKTLVGAFERLGQKLFPITESAGAAAAKTRDLAEASKIAGRAVTDWAEAQRIIGQRNREVIESSGGAVEAAGGQAKADEEAEKAAKARAEALARLQTVQAKGKKAAEELLRLTQDYNRELAELAASTSDATVSLEFLGPAFERLGPSVASVTRSFEELREAMVLTTGAAGVSGLDDVQLKAYIAEMEKLGETGRLTAEQWSALGDAYTEALKRGLIAAENAGDGIDDARDKTDKWGAAIREVSDLFHVLGISADSSLGRIAGAVVAAMAGAEKIGQQVRTLLKDGFRAVDTGQVISGVTAVAGAFKQATDSASGLKRAVGGALVGAKVGSQIGAAFGPIGSAIGAVGGALGGAIVGALRKPGWAKVMEDVGERWGVSISEGLAKQIEEDAKEIGDRVAAELKNLPAIIEEAGGVEAFGLDQAISAAHDLFSMIETGKLSVQEAGETFDEVFSQILPHAINETTGLASEAFLELIALNERFGTESAAVADFLRGENDKLVKSLGVMSEGLVVTERSAAALGASVFVAYQQLREQGVSAKDALAQLQPAIDNLRAKFGELGISGGEAFDSLAAQSALWQDEVAGPLLSGIDATGDAIVALQNQGQLTQAMFTGLTAAIGDTWAKLVEEGKAGPAALQAIAPDLQAVWEMQRRFGYEVDASTQALLREAESAGLVGEKHMSAQERMAAATERTAEVIEALAEFMGVKLPQAAEAGAQGVEDAFAGIRIPPVRIPLTYGNPGRPPIPGVEVPLDVPSLQHGGIGDFGSGTLAMLHGLEAVVPLDHGGAGAALGGDVININMPISEDPYQSAEGRLQLRRHTLRTMEQETSKHLANAIRAGRA